MGGEQRAKAERLDLRKAVVDEAIERVGEFEDRLEKHRKVTNAQGRALEALANVITEERREKLVLLERIARLETLLNASRLFRFKAWRKRRAIAKAQLEERRLEAERRDAAAEAVVDEQSAAAFDAPAAAPDPNHCHQYERDGLSRVGIAAEGRSVMYRCTVLGCDRVVTLEEIDAEAKALQESHEQS